MEKIQLMQGDCLELMKDIPDGSVDLVLTDPPYGTMKGAQLDGWKNQTTEWDNAISPVDIFDKASRILRPNGKCVLFSQEPYTSALITQAMPYLPFSYRAIWYKNVHANPLCAKSAMVSKYEDILIFQKMHDAENVNPLRSYFAEALRYIGFNSCKQINNALGHRRAEHCFYVTGKKKVRQEIGGKCDHATRTGSTQFALCTEETYQELIDKFGIDKMDGFKSYHELSAINEKYTSTFNLWQGNKSKSNVLEYAKDNDGYHPTQKPVALLEDLIQTFSNPNDTVLDFTMGSGSTGVACLNTNRRFIGIELNETYFNIAKERIYATARDTESN